MAIKYISLPTEIHLGPDVIEEFSNTAAKYGNKALFITSRLLFQDSALVNTMVEKLKKAHINVLLYDELDNHTDSDMVDHIAQMGKSSRCDFVIGLGGDIVLNTAKAVALVISNPGDCADYLTEQEGYRLNIAREPLPTLLIPTFFSTMCEANHGFIIKDKDDGIRKKLYNEKILPTVCFLDPSLVMTTSRKYTASSGLMIFAYAMDAIISNRASHISNAFAYKAIDLVSQNLKNLTNDPENLELRNQMFTASLMISYCAHICGLGMVYALCESVASISDIYKGLLASMMLPSFMQYNLNVAASHYAQIARVLEEDVSNLSVTEAAMKAVQRVRLFVEAFKLPSTLKEIGFDKESIPKVSKIFKRFEESNTSPRKIDDQELIALLEKSF